MTRETPETILIVDDEPDLLDALDFNVQQAGFATRLAPTGEDALRLADADPTPDLMVLDLMLPDLSGIEVCRRLREHHAAMPVLMLTAKGDEIDRVVGFEAGADDYLVKPFSVRELLLRIRAILRRTKPGDAEAEEIAFGILRVDPAGHRAWVADEELELTALEFRLLTTLLSRRGRVQSREALLDDVWGIQVDVTTRTVDTHVKRLRHKLGGAAEYIETLRGVGYRFRDQVRAVS